MPSLKTGERTLVQKLPDLVEWFLQHHEVQIHFAANPQRKGKIAPEFDFIFFQQGRRVTERCLCMQINTTLANMNYNYQMSKIFSALVSHSWRFYLANCPYPDWMQEGVSHPLKRPVGRPRKHPPKISLAAQKMLDEVNTGSTETEEYGT